MSKTSKSPKIMKDSTKISLVSLIVLLYAGLHGIYKIIDSGFFDRHYIFTPEKLHALALDSIDKHGNDTRALVANIITTLQADPKIAPYLSVKEEWMFNNAGGAMGAMYMVHASTSFIPQTCISFLTDELQASRSTS